MRKLLLPPLLAGALLARAQAPTNPAVRDLTREGVALHDQGRYAEAVAKYEQALRLDPADVTARAELAMTYLALDRPADAATLCQQLLRENPRPGAEVYVTYGNALDESKQPAAALKAYQLGLRYYPQEYSLYFNQGVAQAGQRDYEAAVASFQRAVALNPNHASSHMLLAGTLLEQDARVPALLALARFLVLEPASRRSPPRRELLDRAMMHGVSQQGEHNVTISVSAASLKKRAGRKGDDFGPEELMLSMEGALSLDSANRAKTPTQRFIDQFGGLCQMMAERKAEAGHGFAREYYVPYFVALQQRGFVPAFAYLAHSSQPNAPDVAEWLAAHPAEVQAFREWSKTYEWPQPGK